MPPRTRRRIPLFIASLVLVAGPASAQALIGADVANGVQPPQPKPDHSSRATRYLVPKVVLPELPARFTLVHDYGSQLLVTVPEPWQLPDVVASRITALEPEGTLSYRAWDGEVPAFDTKKLAHYRDGYYLLTLAGPLDPAWREALNRIDVTAIDVASPYGLLVRSRGDRLALLGGIQTSYGFPVVTGLLSLPDEARLDPGIRDLADGKVTPGAIKGLLRSQDGRGVVRVFPFKDQDLSDVLRRAHGYADPAPQALAHGFADAVLVRGPEIRAILAGVPGAAYVEALHERELHNNLAAKGYILNIEPVWTLGYDGTGIIVDHNDGGVNLTHPDFPSGVVLATYGAMSGTNNEHGTHTAGSVVGRGLAASSPTNTFSCGDVTTPLSTVRGMAWGANLVTNNLFSGGYTTEAGMMQWGYGQGGRLSTNSWGYTSLYTYATYSRAVDTAVRDADSGTGGNQQLCILFSAGNDGPNAGTVGTPGTAKDAITVGASQNDRCGSYVPGNQTGPNINTITTFSGRGPSQGRIKPDIVAVGADVLSVDSQNCTPTASCEEGWDQSWTGPWYRLMPGTSMSCPITAGAAAVFFDFYNTNYGALPSPALAKAALINGAVDTGLGYPSYDQGWGRLNLLRSVQGPPAGHISFVDQSAVTPLATGQSWSKGFAVGAAAVPLKITLVWTDPPGTAGCTSCLVNDLNLLVTAPDGTTYRGNRFTSNWSTPNPGSTTDTANNVENVFVQTPQVGAWTIQVSSALTSTNPPGLNGQDFAVVYSGDSRDCQPLAAPNPVSATANGNNRIDLSWAAVTGAVEYHVFRSTTSGSGFVQVATVTAPTTTWSDTTVDGGITYYYVVRSVGSGASACESSNSPQASATALGACNSPPTFAGITSVTTPLDTTCTLNLTWGAATRQCSGSGSLTYAVYRSTASGFTPALSNRIAAGLTGTTYSDTAGLVSGTTYYYVVRATDTGNEVEDANTVQRSGAPYGPLANVTLFSDTFESGTGLHGWESGCFGTGCSAADWRGIQACTPTHGGNNIFRFGGNACAVNYGSNDNAFVAPGGAAGLAIPADATNVQLSFWHRRAFQSGYDGALMRISNDNANFLYIPAAAPGVWTAGGYNGTVYYPAGQTSTTRDAWTGAANTTFLNTVMNLDAACNYAFGGTAGAAGRTLWIAFGGFSNGSTNNLGWCVDDVTITADRPGSCSASASPVQAFTARATSGAVKLEWVNPTGTYGSTMVRVRTDGTFPTSVSDGTLVCSQGAAGAGNKDSCTHSGLVNGTTYSYSAFVNNGSGVYSSRDTVAARPFDTGGAVQWAYSTGASSLTPPGIWPGSIGTGQVVGVSNDRVLHAMNPSSGGGDWPGSWKPLAMNGPSQARPWVVNIPFGGASREVFVASQDGYVYCVNAETGTLVWASEELGDILQDGPSAVFTAYGGSADLIFACTRNATSDNRIVALDPSNGHTVWSFDNGGGANGIGIISSAPWVDYANSRLYFTSRASGGGSSTTVWCITFTAASAEKLAAFSAPAIGDSDASVALFRPSTAAAERLYVASNAGLVYALDKDTGALIWSSDLGDGPIKGYIFPSWGSNRLFCTTDTQAWCLSDNGAAATQTSGPMLPGGATPSMPLLVGTRLFFGASDGYLYQYDTTTNPWTGTRVVLGSGGAAAGSPSYDWVNTMVQVGSEAGVIYGVSTAQPWGGVP